MVLDRRDFYRFHRCATRRRAMRCFRHAPRGRRKTSITGLAKVKRGEVSSEDLGAEFGGPKDTSHVHQTASLRSRPPAAGGNIFTFTPPQALEDD